MDVANLKIAADVAMDVERAFLRSLPFDVEVHAKRLPNNRCK
jgi:hypothetical protein